MLVPRQTLLPIPNLHVVVDVIAAKCILLGQGDLPWDGKRPIFSLLEGVTTGDCLACENTVCQSVRRLHHDVDGRACVDWTTSTVTHSLLEFQFCFLQSNQSRYILTVAL